MRAFRDEKTAISVKAAAMAEGAIIFDEDSCGSSSAGADAERSRMNCSSLHHSMAGATAVYIGAQSTMITASV